VQRLAPILEAATNVLGIPVRVALLPRLEIQDNRGLPLSSFYRFNAAGSTIGGSSEHEVAAFDNLPLTHVLTMRLDVPEPWNVQQRYAVQDTDNLRCDLSTGECGDDHYRDAGETAAVSSQSNMAEVEYNLLSLLFFGTCYDEDTMVPPNGLQITLNKSHVHGASIHTQFLPKGIDLPTNNESVSPMNDFFSDTLVMKNLGYWQLPATP
jgi:hypothetical protein